MIFAHQKKLYTIKTKEKVEKQFDAVKYMRQVRDTISKETEGMNFEQIKDYFEKRKLNSNKQPPEHQHDITKTGAE